MSADGASNAFAAREPEISPSQALPNAAPEAGKTT